MNFTNCRTRHVAVQTLEDVFRPCRAWKFCWRLTQGVARTRFALGYYLAGFQPCFGDGSERLAFVLNGGLRDCEVKFGSGFGKQSHSRVANCVACSHARPRHFQGSRCRRTAPHRVREVARERLRQRQSNRDARRAVRQNLREPVLRQLGLVVHTSSSPTIFPRP